MGEYVHNPDKRKKDYFRIRDGGRSLSRPGDNIS